MRRTGLRSDESRIKRFPEYACASCAIYARVQDNMSHVRATSRAIYSLAQRSKQQRNNKEIQRECVRDNFISRRKKQRLRTLTGEMRRDKRSIGTIRSRDMYACTNTRVLSSVSIILAEQKVRPDAA